MEINWPEYLAKHSPNYVIEIFADNKTQEILIGDRARPDTLFDIASLTKTFTATLIYLAYEEGKLNLSDLVTSLDQNFINLHSVTILDLLAHKQNIWTAGYLGDAKSRADFNHILYSAYVRKKVPTYTDVHYMILARILETIYQQDYATLIQQMIASPLGINSLTFRPEKSRLLENHDYDDCGRKVVVPLGKVHDYKARRAQELGFATGHAGIFITGADLLKFLQALLNNKLLKPATIQLALEQTGNYYNNFGTRHSLTRVEINDVPPACSEHTTTLSGYTGPMFMIDFERKNIVVIMCHLLADTKLGRLERKKLTEELMNKICASL